MNVVKDRRTIPHYFTRSSPFLDTGTGKRGNRALWMIVIVLLVASALRWTAIAPMASMLMYDEAYNGWDALQLIESPRLIPFLPGNYGRESGWHYWLVPFLVTFGAQPFAIHLAASTVGILAVAAVYRLGVELANQRLGLWSAAALAVLYWHVHVSHLGLRAILVPAVGTLATAAFLRAYRTHANWQWVWGGMWLGVLMYTYFSARLWIVLVGLWLAWWWLTDKQSRPGASLSLLITLVLVLPQLYYAYSHPNEALGRMEEVAMLSAEGVLQNVNAWVQAWFQQGDLNAELNLSGRPILDPALGVLFVIGLLALPFIVRRKAYLLWVLGLAVVSILPSVVSNHAPHFLRSIGLVVPVALVAGAGAYTLTLLDGWVPSSLATVVPAGLLLVVGWSTYRDFQSWLEHPGIYNSMEMHVNEASNWIRDEIPPEMPVYFSPFSVDHPNIAFHKRGLQPRHVGAFSVRMCTIIPDAPAIYVTVTTYEPQFEQHVGHWSELTLLRQSEGTQNDLPRYRVFKGRSRLEEVLSPAEGSPVFQDALRVRYAPLPRSIRASEQIPVVLAFRAEKPLPAVYSAFVHLQGDPTPYEGGRLWAQSDSWLCEPYPTTVWQPDETIVQTFSVPVSAETPPGTYTLAIGIYESPAGERIPLTAPITNPFHYFEIGTIEITQQTR